MTSRHPATTFDTFVAIDWSASAQPARGPDSIWVALGTTDGWAPAGPLTANPSTRHQATEELRGILHEAVAGGRRVLVGTDFPHGYPTGTAAAFGLAGDRPAWRATWDELTRLVTDDERNRTNRFEVAGELNRRVPGAGGPFWGAPPSVTANGLPHRRIGEVDYPVAGLAEWREAERRVREHTAWSPMSVWQTYHRSVGSQALTGIPRLASLRDDPRLADVTRVWPFETGFASDLPAAGPLVVHAEVWPRVVEDRYDPTVTPLDRAQVEAVVAWLLDLERDGSLVDLLAGPTDLDGDLRTTVLDEEGWILGIT